MLPVTLTPSLPLRLPLPLSCAISCLSYFGFYFFVCQFKWKLINLQLL